MPLMPFQPIQDKRLSDKIVEQFTESIRAGEMPVGTRLPPENQLAEQLGVSRGILREALTILEARGYLSRTPKGGTFIKSAVGDDLARALCDQLRQAPYRDLLEFREIMECRAVCNIIERMDEKKLAKLRSLPLDETLEDEEATRLDHYFHYQLAELSGNQIFCSLIDIYYDIIREMRARSLRTQQRRGAAAQEHRIIVEAIVAGDAQGAQNAVRAHLNAVRSSLHAGEEQENGAR